MNKYENRLRKMTNHFWGFIPRKDLLLSIAYYKAQLADACKSYEDYLEPIKEFNDFLLTNQDNEKCSERIAEAFSDRLFAIALFLCELELILRSYPNGALIFKETIKTERQTKKLAMAYFKEKGLSLRQAIGLDQQSTSSISSSPNIGDSL